MEMRATVVLFGPSAVCASASKARAAPTAMPGCPCAHSSLADSSCHSIVSFCRVCSLHANSKTCVAGLLNGDIVYLPMTRLRATTPAPCI